MITDDGAKIEFAVLAPADGFWPSDKSEVVQSEKEKFMRGDSCDCGRIAADTDGARFNGLWIAVEKDNRNLAEVLFHQRMRCDAALDDAARGLPEFEKTGDRGNSIRTFQSVAIGCGVHVFDRLDSPAVRLGIGEHALVFKEV